MTQEQELLHLARMAPFPAVAVLGTWHSDPFESKEGH